MVQLSNVLPSSFKVQATASASGLGSGRGSSILQPEVIEFRGDVLTRRFAKGLDIRHVRPNVVVVKPRFGPTPTVLLQDGERRVVVAVGTGYARLVGALESAGFAVETVSRKGISGMPHFGDQPAASDPWAHRPDPMSDARVLVPPALIGFASAGVAAAVGGAPVAIAVAAALGVIVSLFVAVMLWSR